MQGGEESDDRRERNLKECGSVGDVIPHSSLSSNAYLVLVYRSLSLGLLYPLIPIHLQQNAKGNFRNRVKGNTRVLCYAMLGFRE